MPRCEYAENTTPYRLRRLIGPNIVCRYPGMFCRECPIWIPGGRLGDEGCLVDQTNVSQAVTPTDPLVGTQSWCVVSFETSAKKSPLAGGYCFLRGWHVRVEKCFSSTDSTSPAFRITNDALPITYYGLLMTLFELNLGSCSFEFLFRFLSNLFLHISE